MNVQNLRPLKLENSKVRVVVIVPIRVVLIVSKILQVVAVTPLVQTVDIYLSTAHKVNFLVLVVLVHHKKKARMLQTAQKTESFGTARAVRIIPQWV